MPLAADVSVRGWTHRLYTSTPFLPPMQVHPSYCHFLFCGPVPFMTDVRGACFFMLFFWGSFWCVLFHAILCVAAFFFFKMYFCLSVCPAPRIPYHRPFTLTHTIQQTNKQTTDQTPPNNNQGCSPGSMSRRSRSRTSASAPWPPRWTPRGCCRPTRLGEGLGIDERGWMDGCIYLRANR